jgi:hypothetical protein
MGLVTGRAASYRSLFLERRAELTHLARRTWEVVLLAAVVGVLTGGIVSVLDTIIIGIEEKALEWPLWAVAGLPFVGLVLAALVRRQLVHRRRVPAGLPRLATPTARAALRGPHPRLHHHHRARWADGPRGHLDLQRHLHRLVDPTTHRSAPERP